MKITKIDILNAKTPDNRVAGYEKLGNPSPTCTFCRIWTDEGIYGDGEVAGIHAGLAVYGMLQQIGKLLIGRDPLLNEALWELMYKSTFFGQNGGAVIFSAISALDIALWDIKGKYFGVPVHVLLGGACRDRIRCYASQLQNGWWEIGTPTRICLTLDDYRQCARRAAEEGYDCVKVDFFAWDQEGKRYSRDERERIIHPRHLKEVEERIRAVREEVGPLCEIIVENHSRIDMMGALQIAALVEKYGIMYFEEPNTPNPYTAEVIHNKINIPVAAGERIYSRWQYVPYFENRSLQVIQPDLGNCGGFTEVKKICDMAHAYDVGVQLHTCGSGLATTCSLHLEAVLPNFIIHEHHTRLRSLTAPVTTENPQPVNGYLGLPDKPGLGNEITEYAYELARASGFLTELKP